MIHLVWSGLSDMHTSGVRLALRLHCLSDEWVAVGISLWIYRWRKWVRAYIWVGSATKAPGTKTAFLERRAWAPYKARPCHHCCLAPAAQPGHTQDLLVTTDIPTSV